MLNAPSLKSVATRGVAVPAYPRSGAPGVVHLGLGAFHRAHQALVFDRLLAQGDARWGILGVAMHNPAVADALAAQDGLYAVQLASAVGLSWQVSGAVWQTCLAAREPEQVIAALAAPATRWATLTVTEKGYVPALAELLVRGLARRHLAGLSGLTIASCDNLTHNGRKLQALCEAAAHQHDAALAPWVATACRFPNSMVDRIVPAASPAGLAAAAQALGVADQAALRTEVFWEWVVERNFVDATDAATLASAGVTVVDDVAPFEEAKLRLLNGSHSAMACIGAVAGLPVISDCIQQPAVRDFIHGSMTTEVGPRLQRPDWASYRDALLSRFANPSLQHSVHQIATDSSQKIPQRWVPSALDALRAGPPPERLAFAAAAWMRYLRGVDDNGQPYTLNDPMAVQLQALARTHDASPEASARALGTLTEVWGAELPDNTAWMERVAFRLGRIMQLGLLPALSELNTHCHTAKGTTPA